MDWFIKHIFFLALAVVAVQLIAGEIGPLSEEKILAAKQEYQKMARKLREKCARGHGGNTTADNFEFVIAAIFHPGFNLSEHTASFTHVTQRSLQLQYENGTLDETLFNRCNVSRKHDDDMNKAIWDIFSKCMETDDERKFLGASLNMAKSMSKYICHNAAERVKTVLIEGGLKCIDEKLYEIVRCYQQTETLKSIFQLEYDDKFVLNEKKCSDILEFEACTMETLKSCNTTSAAEFVGGLFNIIKETMPCNFTNKIS